MPTPQATLMVGVLLLAALAAGVVGQLVRLPKVTSYLLVGVLLGWLAPQKIPTEQIEPLTKLAIALVLFNLGCHFPLARIRRIARRTMYLSLGELGATFLLVTIGLMLFRADWSTALLLGALALATAPATTILVLKEVESEGSVTEYANAMVAVNNLVSIVAFELIFLGLLYFEGQLELSPLTKLGQLGSDLIGSVVLGVLAGLFVGYSYVLVAEARRLVLLAGVLTVLLGACMAAEMPYLLAFLAMGLTVANSSYHTREILSELDRLTGLLAVVFFVTHGAELHVDKLPLVGTVGLGYLVLRTTGKYLGTWLAARRIDEEPDVRRWLGATLMAQAGVAITLSAIAVDRTEGHLHEVCLNIQTIILGTVVVFEILGPLLIRYAVVQAGEVTLAHAIHRPGSGPLEQLRTVWNRLLIAFGYDPWVGQSEDDLTIKDIMRKNITAVPHSATFDQVIARLEHSRDNTFPVVDEAGELIGVIRYRELSHALFDRALGGLVLAADVTTTTGRVLHPDEPISRASAIFAASKDDCIPVTTSESPHLLLGIVRRRDVFRLLIRELP